jgi:hypothetical protein
VLQDPFAGGAEEVHRPSSNKAKFLIMEGKHVKINGHYVKDQIIVGGRLADELFELRGRG